MIDDVLVELNKKYINKKYNKLTILEVQKEIIPSRKQPVEYKVFCLCECGESIYTNLRSVQSSMTKSCGCLSRTMNGATYERIYWLWVRLKSTGSGVSAEWMDFATFKDWCEKEGFEHYKSVQSFDYTKPIGPGNAFVTKKHPNQGKRKSEPYLFVSPDGEDHVVFDFYDFCYEKGLNPMMAYRSIRNYEEFLVTGKKQNSIHKGWTIKRLKEEDFRKPTYEDRLYYPYTDLF